MTRGSETLSDLTGLRRCPAHLGEAALVIEDAEDAVRLQRDEVDAGLVVREGDLPPVDLFPDVLLLQAAELSPLVLPRLHPPCLLAGPRCLHIS